MAIRLNLLAEAQAAEDLRRRDPVKRAIWIAALLLVLILAWSSSLQFQAILAGSEVSRMEAQVKSHTSAFQQVMDNQKKILDLQDKLARLRQLSTNRVLQGSVLNALQQCTVEDVRLLRFKVEQIYTLTDAVKTKTNSAGHTVPGKPATATEHLRLLLDGTDFSANPGDQVSRLVEALGANATFRLLLARTNGVTLQNLSPPQILPGIAKPGVVFALEGHCLEVTR